MWVLYVLGPFQHFKCRSLHTHTRAHIYTHEYTHTHAYTHTHTHTHTRMHALTHTHRVTAWSSGDRNRICTHLHEWRIYFIHSGNTCSCHNHTNSWFTLTVVMRIIPCHFEASEMLTLTVELQFAQVSNSQLLP